LISRSLVRKTVSATVKFDSQLCFGAEKIEEVDAAWILAAEFEFAEAPIAQQAPEAFLSVG